MEFNEMLSKSIEKENRIWQDKNWVEEKLKKGGLSEEEKKILEQRKEVLEKKSKQIQKATYL